MNTLDPSILEGLITKFGRPAHPALAVDTRCPCCGRGVAPLRATYPRGTHYVSTPSGSHPQGSS